MRCRLTSMSVSRAILSLLTAGYSIKAAVAPDHPC